MDATPSVARYDWIMLVEVQSASKPGRPTVLLLVSAGILAASLGAAWIQTHEKLALAEPRPLAAGSPLIIRPPRGWVEDRPGTFVLLQRMAGEEREAIERRVIFTHQPAVGYVDPRDIILSWDRRVTGGAIEPTPARLGGIEAVQVMLRRRVAAFGGFVEKETVLRVACYPTGDIVGVEYWPMEAMTVADDQLMDSICDAVTLSTVQVPAASHSVMEAVGVDFAVPEDCAVLGGGAEALPSLFVQSTNPMLPFVIEMRRTWLAPGRTANDLLADYCRMAFPWVRSEPRVANHGRPDRVSVSTLHLPASLGLGRVAPAIVVEKSAGECVMITYRAKDEVAGVAGRLAQALADSITVTASPSMPDLEAALKGGVELAALLRERGALPWWGRQRQDAIFVGRTGDVAASRIRVVPRDGGYAGSTTSVNARTRGATRTAWRIDEHAEAYSLEFQRQQIEHLEPDVVVVEAREADKHVLHRGRRANGVVTGEKTIPIGPAFVAPPVEPVAAAWAARRESGAWAVTVSTLEGGGVCSRLLIGLPVSGLGELRVLVVDDYDPTGWVARFDGNDRPLNDRRFGLDLDRREGDDPRDERVLNLLERAESTPMRR